MIPWQHHFHILTVTKYYHRFDERTLLLYFGVVSCIIGRIAFFPIPGNDNEHICNDTVTTVSPNMTLHTWPETSTNVAFRFEWNHGNLPETSENASSLLHNIYGSSDHRKFVSLCIQIMAH